jgi:hypothetical protein
MKCRAVVVLTVKGRGNVVEAVIRPLLASSSTTAWTRRRPRRLGGDDARFWWVSCGKEGRVGDKCSAAPRAEVEKKLGEEMLGVYQLKGGGGCLVRHDTKEGGARQRQDLVAAAPGRAEHGRGKIAGSSFMAVMGRLRKKGEQDWGERKEVGPTPNEWC